MADIYRLHGSPHDDIQALLPWYVNGTLAAEEIARIEAHLSECAECRAELESEHSLARGIATMPLGVEHGWSSMKRQMSADPPPQPVPEEQSFLRRRIPIGWALAVPLAAAAAVALMFTVLPVGTPTEQTYHALGSPAADNQGNLVVLFKPDSTEQQIRVVLTANNARLVDGPTAAGAYILQVEDARRDQALQRLRQSGQIVLAEPLEPAGPQ